MSKRTLWIIAITVLIAAVVIIGFYQYNRQPAGVESRTATAITASDLADAFVADEAGANKQYLNQVLEVSGTVSEVSKNEDSKTVLLLAGSDPLSGVQCTMREGGDALKTGTKVTVKGFCNGYTVVVILSDCILNKP